MRAGPGCGGEHEAAGDGLATRPAPRDDRDRGERGAHPDRAGGRSDDAFDGAVGAARRPVIALRADLKVVMAAHPIDFRKSVHTLSALVSEALRTNPYCGDVFVFRSKRMDRVKLLAWDGTEMVLALDAENEKLRVLMRTLNDMIFGKRSERLAAIVAEQLALELDDLATGVTPPLPANDDTPAPKPPASPRKKASRNI